jgi:hypothetical protein
MSMNTLRAASSSTPSGTGVPSPKTASPASVLARSDSSQDPEKASRDRCRSGETIFSAPTTRTTSAMPLPT